MHRKETKPLEFTVMFIFVWFLAVGIYPSCGCFLCYTLEPCALFLDILYSSEPWLLTDLWPAVWYLICVALLLFLSLTSSLCNCTTEKKKSEELLFFEEEEEEIATLQTAHSQADEVQQVPNQWDKRATTGSEICTMMLQQYIRGETASLAKFTGFVISQM